MKEPTAVGLRALAKLDGTIPPLLVDRAIETMCGKTAAGLTGKELKDRLLSRNQVAELLGVTPKTVDVYARKGLLEKKKVLGVRAAGITVSSYERLFARRKGMVA